MNVDCFRRRLTTQDDQHARDLILQHRRFTVHGVRSEGFLGQIESKLEIVENTDTQATCGQWRFDQSNFG